MANTESAISKRALLRLYAIPTGKRAASAKIGPSEIKMPINATGMRK
jgi:hypothetical protein